MTTKPKLEISPDDALHEELSELLGDEENWHNYPSTVAALKALHLARNDKRSGNDTAVRRHEYYKSAGLYRLKRGKAKLREQAAYRQFIDSTGFRNTVLVMLERRGVETTIHTLAGIQSTQTCLFATSASAYYRMQTEQSTDGIAMPLTHKTVKTKYGAIQTVSGLLNTSTKQLESEYMRHHDSVMMLPQFHAYLLEKLGPPTPNEIQSFSWG